MTASDFFVMTKSLDAFVKTLRHSKQIAARGRRPNQWVDGLIARLQSCYEATGGRIAFRKNSEGRRVLGQYPDFLRAMRRHVFQRKVLSSDEAFIDRARKARSFRGEQVRRLRSKFRLAIKAMFFWAGAEAD
jgi:hypothetical protein